MLKNASMDFLSPTIRCQGVNISLNCYILMLLAGVTPLHFAVSHKEVAAVRYFLEKGADPNIKDSSNGTTSLHEAAGLGNYCCTFHSVVNDY
jgi:hypothetical protein